MFADPYTNIERAKIAEGMTVADFGSGVGYYALAMAEKVGPYGKVYAIDVQDQHLSALSNEASRRGIKNIEIIRGDLESKNGSGLLPASVDRVVMSNMFFQADHPEKIAAEARRVLKGHGKAVVIDWADSYNQIGPHPDHVISPREIEKAFAVNGFILEEVFDAGSHHFGILFKM